MVAKITFPRRLADAVRYSERKVKSGVAQCIGAAGYLRDARELTAAQKLQVLQRQSALNGRAATKTLHVSLNFHPSEMLSNEVLLQIAGQYMEGIGFGEQPYLVYRHYDAGHPHVHVVSTLIRADGTRIPTHGLGRTASERTRKKVEQAFGLVAAERREKDLDRQPVATGKVVYGRQETKSSVAHAVQLVMTKYNCTTLEQFNAALRAFNVEADRGRAGSRLFEGGGLVYHVLSEGGKRIGVPIKASDLPEKPTLKKLEACFGENRLRAQGFRKEQRTEAEAAPAAQLKGAKEVKSLSPPPGEITGGRNRAALLPTIHRPANALATTEQSTAELLIKKKRKRKKGHHPS